VHVSFWEDSKVVEEMTPEDKFFYLYLLTNPNTTQIGIYPITKKKMAFDMGYSLESANALIDRFENHHQVIKYNQETREVALLNWGKYNLNRGGKPVEDCMRKELKEVKDKNLIHLVSQKVGNDRLKSLYLARLNDTSHDTIDDTSTTRPTTSGQKEKQKEKRPKENLSSTKDVETFVEKQMLSNPSPINRKILVKYIDCLRFYRKLLEFLPTF
jgi:hypothetical protein